jgi:DNA repair protein RecO (recombination protein O)
MKSIYSGFVLGTRKFKDNLKIVSLFTEESGCLSFLTRISKTKPTHHLFQPLNKIQGSANSHSESLRIISQVELLNSYKEIPFHAYKSTVALFVCEFLYRVLPEHYPNASVYNLLNELAELLDHPQNFSGMVPTFLVKFCQEMGILDQAESFKKETKPEVVDAVNQISQFSLMEGAQTKLPREIRLEIINLCIHQCESAFEKQLSLKSLDMFQEVFH